MLLAAQVTTSSSIASASTVSSASQFSAETLLAVLERPSTFLSQSVGVVIDTRTRPSEDPTVATRPFVHFCDPAAVTLPLHSTPLESTSTHETPARFGTQYVSPVSGHSPGPPVLSPQLPLTHTNCQSLYTIAIYVRQTDR